MVSDFDVRRLVPGDAEPYRALMVGAYRDERDAFTSTAAERESLPLTWWEARIAVVADAAELVFGAFVEQQLVGVAGLTYERRTRTKHKATLFGMFVHPDFRGRGIAGALVRAVLAQARAAPGVEVVQLTVTETNEPALRLYERCGFRVFGAEPLAVRIGADFLGKTHMWCAVGDHTGDGAQAKNAGHEFAHRTRKDGNVEVLHRGRLAATLRGPDASDFLARTGAASEDAAQQLMARVTGNYRRGNERVAAQHPRNRR
jgi:RimJ/RimL family protein N-acetyltransferase